MTIGIAGAMIGIVIAACRGGRPTPPRQWQVEWAVPGGLALGVVVATRIGISDSGVLLAGALGVLVAVCLANLHLPGTGVLALGLLANLLPLALVGATPVDPEALTSVGADTGSILPTQALVRDTTPVPVLAARIPVPVAGAVVSFGDLIAAAGLGALAHSLLLLGRRRPGIPVGRILADGPLTLTVDGPTAPAPEPAVPLAPVPFAQWPVEVGPGQPVPIPLGWARDDDLPVPAWIGRRSRAHPTMRLGHR
jgi:hypothetical protein